jgi:transcriptional regulator with XRE-family HTH domain
MAASGTNSRQGELGDFLRSRRQKLMPKTVGLPVGRRRRTPGLRREEVAELAGIGVDWYIRLEQGRTVSPSAATIDALARALRLTKAEHRYLRELTQNTDRRPLRPRDRPAGDPSHRRIAQSAGLCHRTALGHSRLECGCGGDLCVQPAGGGRSQQPAVGIDQPRDAAAVRRIMGG